MNGKSYLGNLYTDPIRILITGDFCPIYRIEELALKRDYESIFNDFIDVFKDNDLNITDLECPLTHSESARSKVGPHQKAHPDCIKVLKHAGIHLATMSNNHIMDYGKSGVSEAIGLCRLNCIDTVGIGKTPEEARACYSVNIKKNRIAVLNFADKEFLTAPDASFTCNPLDTVQLFYDITKAKNNHDFVIIIVHAGNEFYNLPSPRTKKLYRFIIDAGADAVLAHHTHVFSGYEVYKSKPIFYGLGNFVYDWPGKRNGNWNNGFVVRLLLSDKIDFEIVPLKQGNENPGIFHLDDAETEAFFRDIDRMNMIIGDDDKLESAFQEYCNSVFPMYDAFIEPYFGKYISALRKRGYFPKLMTRRKRLLLLNIIRCESHRDVLLKMLNRCEK